ncbi:hypothetical protein OROGR_032740 [Orobanche gracilis]
MEILLIWLEANVPIVVSRRTAKGRLPHQPEFANSRNCYPQAKSIESSSRKLVGRDNTSTLTATVILLIWLEANVPIVVSRRTAKGRLPHQPEFANSRNCYPQAKSIESSSRKLVGRDNTSTLTATVILLIWLEANVPIVVSRRTAKGRLPHQPEFANSRNCYPQAKSIESSSRKLVGRDNTSTLTATVILLIWLEANVPIVVSRRTAKGRLPHQPEFANSRNCYPQAKSIESSSRKLVGRDNTSTLTATVILLIWLEANVPIVVSRRTAKGRLPHQPEFANSRNCYPQAKVSFSHIKCSRFVFLFF